MAKAGGREERVVVAEADDAVVLEVAGVVARVEVQAAGLAGDQAAAEEAQAGREVVVVVCAVALAAALAAARAVARAAFLLEEYSLRRSLSRAACRGREVFWG